MLVVMEPLCCGIEHTPLNAAMLEMCRVAFPDRAISFYAEPRHLAEVQRLVDSSTRQAIDWQAIAIPPRRSGFFTRFPIELRSLRALFRTAHSRGGHVLLLSAVEPTIFATKALHWAFGYRIPVQAVLHGYLNEIVGWRSRNPLVRARDLRSALSFGADPFLKYVVLEQGIARRLIELLPSLVGHVDWLPHPIPPEGGSYPQIPPLPLRLSFLGLATAQKGFGLFVDAAEACVRRFPGRLEFHAIGRLARDEPPRDLAALSTTPQPQGLSRVEYVEAITRTHFVCLPYRGTHYELSASGVLLDAIAWCKPIIGMRSPALQEMFASNPGIGYLCSTRDEMLEVIAKLACEFDEKTYEQQTKAMSELRRLRTPEELAKRYRRITTDFLDQCCGTQTD